MVLEIHIESQGQDFISFLCLQKLMNVWKVVFPTLKKGLLLLLEKCQNLKAHLRRETKSWARTGADLPSKDLLDVNSSLKCMASSSVGQADFRNVYAFSIVAEVEAQFFSDWCLKVSSSCE